MPSKFDIDGSGNVTASGVIESSSGGFKFPDGTMQVTAAAGGGGPPGSADPSTLVDCLMNADLTTMCTYVSSAYIMRDGIVKTSGGPRQGNLGSGDYQNSHLRPVPLSFDNQNVGPIVSVIMNTHGGHALTAAGDIWGWGGNSCGQVGDGTYTTRYVPVPVYWGAYPKPRIIKLACTTTEERNYYDCPAWYALDDTGRVWSWGYNGYGQLAIAPGNRSSQPQPFLTNITNVVDIQASGGLFGAVFAIKSDGSVWSAGFNNHGLDITGYPGGTSDIWKKIILPIGCIKVSTTMERHDDGYGYGHTLYLLSDGRVFSSGYNSYGQLGIGTNVNLNSGPVEINSLSNITDLWVGGGLWGCSFAVNASGDFFVWGANGYGQLGIGTTANENRPKPHPIKNVKSVKIGGWGSYNHSLLLTQSGQVYAAGNNEYGQLGLGCSGQPTSKPPYTHNLVLLPQGVQGNISQIAVSGWSNAATSQMLDSNGYVWACGCNNLHQLAANPSFDQSRHTMPTRVMF